MPLRLASRFFIAFDDAITSTTDVAVMNEKIQSKTYFGLTNNRIPLLWYSKYMHLFWLSIFYCFKPIPNMGIEIHKPAFAMANGMVKAPVPTMRFET